MEKIEITVLSQYPFGLNICNNYFFKWKNSIIIFTNEYNDRKIYRFSY